MFVFTVTNSPAAKNMPLPPIPQPSGGPVANGTGDRRGPGQRPAKEKKIYVAAYDYKPCEEGDLELITVRMFKKQPYNKKNSVQGFFPDIL